MKRIKDYMIHIGIEVGLAIVSYITAFFVLFFLLPVLGYAVIVVYILFIILAQVYFYYLSTYTGIWLTILSFALNLVLMLIELDYLEDLFYYLQFNRHISFDSIIILVGGLLWAINKLILDGIFTALKANMSPVNRIDNFRKWLYAEDEDIAL